MKRRSKRPRKTKFTAKETKDITILGVGLGVLSLFAVIILVCISFFRDGDVTLSLAFAGLLASLFSVGGLIISFLCLIDHYQEHLLGWIGLVFNGVSVLSLAGILYLGMF